MGIRARLRNRLQQSRADLFVRLMAPRRGMRVLDLGGGDSSLAERIAHRVPLRVTVADISDEHAVAALARGFCHQVVPESGELPFADGSFDVVLCNSVIEHATLPKDACRVSVRVPQETWRKSARHSQAGLAREIQRIGRGWFVQTPHRHFPIDQHVQFPLVHYLSHNATCRVVALTDRFWVKSCLGIVDWELFTPAQLLELFPSARIHVERFLGLPKSIVAWKAPAPSGEPSDHQEGPRPELVARHEGTGHSERGE